MFLVFDVVDTSKKYINAVAIKMENKIQYTKEIREKKVQDKKPFKGSNKIKTKIKSSDHIYDWTKKRK